MTQKQCVRTHKCNLSEMGRVSRKSQDTVIFWLGSSADCRVLVRVISGKGLGDRLASTSNACKPEALGKIRTKPLRFIGRLGGWGAAMLLPYNDD